MSGGTFDHTDYCIQDFANQIQGLIDSNDNEDEYGYMRGYSAKTIEEFKTAVDLLSKAAIYVHRIDWLVAGDDAEDTFHERLAEKLKRYEASK